MPLQALILRKIKFNILSLWCVLITFIKREKNFGKRMCISPLRIIPILLMGRKKFNYRALMESENHLFIYFQHELLFISCSTLFTFFLIIFCMQSQQQKDSSGTNKCPFQCFSEGIELPKRMPIIQKHKSSNEGGRRPQKPKYRYGRW